jgi:aspartate/methionine/tyrosine aminotransferase
LLNEIPGFKCPTPTGAFYVYPSVKGVLGTTIRGKTPKTSAELATLILEEAEVAAVPGEAFGPSGYLRFSYATSDEDIIEGIGRIKKLITEG